MPSGHPFVLAGGDPALDFLNTIHDWTLPAPRDHLPTFADAIRFAGQAGLLTPGEARRLGRGPAGSELARLRALRALLERIFRARVGGRRTTPADLEALSRAARSAAGRARLVPARRGLARVIGVDAAGPAVVRWRLVEAAVGLLTSARLLRVGACPGCGWFFLDTTKNGSRRWCSMTMCGGAAKARRYYRRKRARAGAPSRTAQYFGRSDRG